MRREHVPVAIRLLSREGSCQDGRMKVREQAPVHFLDI